MELTDSITIASLIPVRRPIARHNISRKLFRTDDTHPGRRRTCQCGSCITCLDNAKWNRIFSEKFEDPDYYRPRSTWGGSSLASFC